jgi:hypothetical protein
MVFVAVATLSFASVAAEDPPPYQPKAEMVDGNELTFVYFGGNGCAPCVAPGMKEAVIKARAMIAQLAAKEHRPFSATGVALDSDIAKGVAFLDTVGPWDQIVVGREWFNSAVLDLMATGPLEPMVGIPQIIIYERRIEHRGHELIASNPRILARIPGTAIPLWVNAGAQVGLRRE